MNIQMNRRTMLMAGSTALMLPLLESNLIAAGASKEIPKRLVFLPMGFGVNVDNWLPSTKEVGTNYKIPPLLESFKDLKSDFSIIQNLSNRIKGTAHAGSMNFLTCGRVGASGMPSCDQVAAEVLGTDTRHSSLAIASARQANNGHGDYTSWAADGKPVGVERDLTGLYASLFGSGGKAEEIKRKIARNQSGLDAILGNAKRLNGEISSSDRHRIDEYFTSIRNVEKRLSKAKEWAETPYPKAPYPVPSKRVNGKMELELTLDMMHLAIASDSTRVMTYMLPTQPVLKELGIGGNPHRMSHKASGPLDPNATHQRRDRMLAELVAQFVTKLKNTKESDGSSLLDHTLVAYGSVLRAAHNQSNGPMLLAGHGGGGLKQGQNLVYEKNTPLSNLWLSMLRHVGVNRNEFADSKDVLSEMGFK